MVKLIWSPRSLNDLEIIFDYIRPDSIENARGFINKIVETTLTIPECPFAGRKVPEYKDPTYREKIYERYRIIYRVDKEFIEVVTILHQSRRLNYY
jgi:plasmid stabilization system protein ParE